jgi:GT2 family glycosyltransferase
MASNRKENLNPRIEELPASYRDEVEDYFYEPALSVAESVVIVTYQTPEEELDRLLTALDEQTVDDFEVIVVDNGNEWAVDGLVSQFEHVTAYVKLRRNCGVTTARNLGAHLAGSSLVVFIDDDGVPEPDFVAAHRRAHRDNVVGVRGRVVPIDDTVYNRRQSWYDLGDEPMPYYLNVEGNCSFDRQAFLSVGGFAEDLHGRAGHEGIELTYRLVTEAGYTRDQFIYDPNPVLHHNVASGVIPYIMKRVTRGHNRDRIREWHPELSEFLKYYPDPSALNRLSGTDRIAVAVLDRMINLGRVLVRVTSSVRRT